MNNKASVAHQIARRMKYRQPGVLPLLRERLREVIPSLVYPAANQSAEAQAFASLVFTNPAAILAE
jgi:hypothetical protein